MAIEISHSEIYLDNSATTRVCPAAAEAVMNALSEEYGNPSSLHDKGYRAEKLLDLARRQVAGAMGCAPDELYFSPGGTYSDNAAIFGAAQSMKRRGKRVVTTALEHPAVANCMKRLEEEGFDVVRLPCREGGHFTGEDLAAALTADTVLVSVMAVNNETGVVNDVGAVRSAIKAAGSPALLHCDAVQAFGKLPPSSFMHADLVSVSSHKVHGPKGAGALYVRKGVRILPYIFGGGQEKGLFSGTQATPAIFGFAAACGEFGDIKAELDRIAALRGAFVSALSDGDRFSFNSPGDALPYIINLSVNGVPSEVTVNSLSALGIYVSAGSACHKGKRSDVLSAMGFSAARTDSAVRVSLSRYTTAEDMERCADALKAVSKRSKR